MDIFAEQLVKKEMSSQDKLKKSLILAGSLILGGISIFITYSIDYYYLFAGIVICIALIVGGFFLSKNMNIEYEYSVTNGEMDIDKIINQNKRTTLLSVKISEFTAYGKYTEETTETDESTTFIMACDGTEKGYWYADFNGDYGKSRLLFSPNEKIRNAIKPYLTSAIKISLKKEEK